METRVEEEKNKVEVSGIRLGPGNGCRGNVAVA